jgi:hypothetical protein
MVKPEADRSRGCLNKADIGSWYQDLCEDAASAEYGPTIAGTIALELRRMKERNMKAEHEYFIAKIPHPDGKVRFLRIERFREDFIAVTTSQRITAQVSSSMESFKLRPADDMVFTVDELAKGRQSARKSRC